MFRMLKSLHRFADYSNSINEFIQKRISRNMKQTNSQSGTFFNQVRRVKGQGRYYKQFKELCNQWYRKKNPIKIKKLVVDPLYFHYQNYFQKKDFKTIIENYVLSKNFEIQISTAVKVLYNASKNNCATYQLFAKFEPVIYIKTGSITRRMIYGLLYSVIKSNLYLQKLFDFINEEMILLKPYFEFQELIELLEAVNQSTLLTLNKKQQFIMKYKFQIELKLFPQLKHRRDLNKRYRKVLIQTELFQPELWENIDEICKYLNHWEKLEFAQSLKIPADYIQTINQIRSNLLEQVYQDSDIRWRYNIEEERFYTNKQMIQKAHQYNLDKKILSIDFQSLEKLKKSFEQKQALLKLYQQKSELGKKSIKVQNIIFNEYYKKINEKIMKGQNLLQFKKQYYLELFGLTSQQIDRQYEDIKQKMKMQIIKSQNILDSNIESINQMVQKKLNQFQLISQDQNQINQLQQEQQHQYQQKDNQLSQQQEQQEQQIQKEQQEQKEQQQQQEQQKKPSNQQK